MSFLLTWLGYTIALVLLGMPAVFIAAILLCVWVMLSCIAWGWVISAAKELHAWRNEARQLRADARTRRNW